MQTWIITNEEGQEIKVRVESISDLPEAFQSTPGEMSDVIKAERVDDQAD